ncbi:MAG: carbon monoxide dehydrogenase, partial [Paracoccaceae bacterium]
MITWFPARARGPAERVAGFLAHLRGNGVSLGVQDCGLALAALREVRVDMAEVRLALKAVCTSCPEDFARFDDLFAAYWTNAGREKPGQARGPRDRQRTSSAAEQDGTRGGGRAERPDTDGQGEAEQQGEGRLVGSRIHNLLRVDLREVVDPADMAEACAVAERLARAIRDRRSRRRQAAKRGE